ncbi:unnamed protein product [Ixodes pacificus]
MARLPQFLVISGILCALAAGKVFLKPKDAPKNKCHRYHALKRFSACGTVVGQAAREKSLLENPNHNATCIKAQAFDSCFQESMRATRCTRGSEFSFHLQHIASLVNEMYKESCSPGGDVSSVLTDMSTVCDIRVAVVRFLECASSFFIGEPRAGVARGRTDTDTTLGVHFGVIFDAPALGTVNKFNRIANIDCRRSVKFRNCMDNIHLYSECGVGTEVYSHLKYMSGVVRRKFAGKCTTEPQMPDLDCQLLPFLWKFLRCGVNRYESPEERIDQDACAQVSSYKDCVAAAERVAHCNMKNLSLSYHLQYLHKVMTMVNTSCRGVRNVETSVYKEACKRTALFNNYFSCGMEVQARLEGLNMADKERCRVSENFEKCFLSAKEQSGCLLADEATSIMSALLDTWKKEHTKECAALKVPSSPINQVECLAGPSVRKVFLCGLNFQTAVREVKYSPKEISAEVCWHLNELNACISDVKGRTQCALSELHAHVAPLLQPFTIDYVERCERLMSSNTSSPIMVPNGSFCRRLLALKRIFHCGLSFSKILEEMELVRHKVDVLCPLLKKYETCVPDSANEHGCKDDLVMRGHVKSFGRILRKQYYDACVKIRRVGIGNMRRVSDLPENRTSEIFGNVKVLRQEFRRGVNISTDPQAQVAMNQVMEDYYGSDYEDYIEEEDKVPDSLDVKPAYDYAENDATRKPQKPSFFKTVEAAHERLFHNISRGIQNPVSLPEQRKDQEFWAGVERARKLKSRHSYDPGSLDTLQDLSNKQVDRDFARPGTYFIDQLSNPSAVEGEAYDPNKQLAGENNKSIRRVNGMHRGLHQNSPSLYKSFHDVPHAARQGKLQADEYNVRSGSSLTPQEELEMYEDTRGMSELLQKEREGGYNRYRSGDGAGPRHVSQWSGRDVHRRFHAGDGMVQSDTSLPRNGYNNSFAYYDYHGVPSSRIYKYPPSYRHQSNLNAGVNDRGVRRVVAPFDARRRRILQGPKNGFQRRRRAFRNPEYEFVGEYEKPVGSVRHSGDPDYEAVSKDIVSFPEDDGPVLPNDDVLSHEVRHHESRGFVPVRRREDKNLVGSVRDLEAPRGVVEVNEPGNPVFKEGNLNTISNNKVPPDSHPPLESKEPYNPRKLSSNKRYWNLGSPIDTHFLQGTKHEDYGEDTRDYDSVRRKIDSDTRGSGKSEGDKIMSRSGDKRAESKERQHNPNYYSMGGDAKDMGSDVQNRPFKRQHNTGLEYRETNKRGVNSYREELQPHPEARHYYNDSSYVSPNVVLQEPGLRFPKEKVQPDFLGSDSRRSNKDLHRERNIDSGRINRNGFETKTNTKNKQGASPENLVQPSHKRFFNTNMRHREPRMRFRYVDRIEETPGLLLEKKDEASGSSLSSHQTGKSKPQLTQYEIERKMKTRQLKKDLNELLSKHKEEGDTKDDLMLFPDEKLGRGEKIIKDFDGKALEESKDYSELDAKLDSNGGDRGAMWSGASDDMKDELLRKHAEIPDKNDDSVIGELSKRNAWYTDDIWSDSNDLFGMERLLSDQRKGTAANTTDADDNAQCQLQYLQRRSDACVRVFDDDFRAIGNDTVRQFTVNSMTPTLRKSVCTHARDFAQCINLFAQKFRCLESQDIINNLTDHHLRKAGVMFCAASTTLSRTGFLLAALLLHVVQAQKLRQ